MSRLKMRETTSGDVVISTTGNDDDDDDDVNRPCFNHDSQVAYNILHLELWSHRKWQPP